eukprot:1305576-Rhodomonas_salina.2
MPSSALFCASGALTSALARASARRFPALTSNLCRRQHALSNDSPPPPRHRPPVSRRGVWKAHLRGDRLPAGLSLHGPCRDLV